MSTCLEVGTLEATDTQSHSGLVRRVNADGRRVYEQQAKLAVVREAMAPGVSLAKVALRHGLNANLLRKWMGARGVTAPSLRRPDEFAESVTGAAEFLPVAVNPTEPSQAEIRIEARRGNAVVKIEWPVVAATECAAWLRGWLK